MLSTSASGAAGLVRATLLASALLLPAWPGPPARAAEPAQVTVPLARFNALTAAARHGGGGGLQGTAVSSAAVLVAVPAPGAGPVRVEATVKVHVLEAGLVAIPLLPAGVTVLEARAGGAEVALSAVGRELAWTVKDPGIYTLRLVYTVAATRTDRGGTVRLPVPPAAALKLVATLPGVGHAVSVVPATGFTATAQGDVTRVEADLPATAGVSVAWQAPMERPFLLTSARYAGRPGPKLMAWEAEIGVRVLAAGPVLVPLFASDVAVAAVTVDGKPALLDEAGGQLRVQLPGAGAYVVAARFETPIDRESGPTATTLWLPRPPVATFALTLPGRKEVSVTPLGGVDHRVVGGDTVATVRLAPADEATFSWSEALPEEADRAARANAEVYHVVRVEEGVLRFEAVVDVTVTRGSVSVLTARLPAAALVNGVRGEGVVDWRSSEEPGAGGGRTLTAYLNRDVTGSYRYRVDYEVLVGAGRSPADAVGLPLLVPAGVHRQRGMVALVAGSELTMRPADAAAMNTVGDNQLPLWLRQEIKGTVAHTFKYGDPTAAALTVRLDKAEKRQARFDAEVDTLLSIGDGVLRAAASVGITVKSGTLMELDLAFPAGVNLLSVTAPGLRDHKLEEAAGRRTLRLQFNREVEGALRVEVAYERVLGADLAEVPVPALHVVGASPEHGRLAVEALSAVEVRASRAERLLPVDAQELPRDLVLRTSNPILLAYKYVHVAAEVPFTLSLAVTRHAELEVQVAAIDQAVYETLITRDGVALTRAVYTLRNRRKQFLAVALPAGADVWSAQLDGRAVKPARGGAPDTVLIGLLDSSQPFVVELVYALPIDALGFTGRIAGELPVPDVVETRTRWDVYLPEGPEYGAVATTMRQIGPLELIAAGPDGGLPVAAALDASATTGATAGAGAARGGVLPLRIEVPRRGVRLRLDKLLANQGRSRASFSVRYAGQGAGAAGSLAAAAGALLAAMWLLVLLGLGPASRRRQAGVLVLLGGAAAVAGVAVLGAGLGWALGGAAAGAAVHVVRWLLGRRGAGAAAEPVAAG